MSIFKHAGLHIVMLVKANKIHIANGDNFVLCPFSRPFQQNINVKIEER